MFQDTAGEEQGQGWIGAFWTAGRGKFPRAGKYSYDCSWEIKRGNSDSSFMPAFGACQYCF